MSESNLLRALSYGIVIVRIKREGEDALRAPCIRVQSSVRRLHFTAKPVSLVHACMRLGRADPES